MKPVLELMPTAVAAVLVSGCTITGRIDHDVVDFNRAVESTSNQVAFLNVLRSYEGLPRHYTSISDIKGSLTVTGAGELSTVLNPGRVFTQEGIRTNTTGNENTDLNTNVTSTKSTSASSRDVSTPKLAGSVVTNPNYTVAVLESQDFYRGILDPLDAKTIALFLSQGWDSDLILHTLVEGLWITLDSGYRYYLENSLDGDPDDEAWSDLVEKINVRPKKIPSKSTPIAELSTLSGTDIAKLYEADLRVRSCSDKKTRRKHKCLSYFNSKITSETAANFSIAFKRRKPQSACPNALIDGDEKKPKKLVEHIVALDFEFGKDGAGTTTTPSPCPSPVKSLELVTRGADGVIYYIGEYLRKTTTCRTKEICIGGKYLFKYDDDVWRKDHILSAVLNGKTYHIPSSSKTACPNNPLGITGRNGNRSMQVLALIQQLVNLNKKSEDLPKPTFIQID